MFSRYGNNREIIFEGFSELEQNPKISEISSATFLQHICAKKIDRWPEEDEEIADMLLKAEKNSLTRDAFAFASISTTWNKSEMKSETDSNCRLRIQEYSEIYVKIIFTFKDNRESWK